MLYQLNPLELLQERIQSVLTLGSDQTLSRHNFVEWTDTSLAETTLSNIQGQFPNQSYQSSKTPILKPAVKSSGRFLSLPNVSKPLPTSS